ncbi:MAG TPA: SDR family oxidoreductase [Thermoleophilaceae bacterium]|nr:SDR family oxidoreductase [Thermoleophilaceae bacterium]
MTADYRSPLRADANDGRVAVVTGGGTGIGRATALELAATGARVVVCGRREDPLARVSSEVEELCGECLAVPADLREPQDVARVVDAALERFGSVDVLVNNAGGQFTAAAEEISDNGWRAVQRASVDAVWSISRTVATRSMIPGGGGLIVFVGFSPLRGIPGFAHGSAARAAVANRLGARARVEPPRDPERLRSARHDPHGGARGLRGRGGRRVGTLGPAGAAGPAGGGCCADRLPRHRRRRLRDRHDGRGRRGSDAWGLAEPPPGPPRR